ncbi:MAG: glycosyltransferase family 2 protein [Eubacterium sp.]|jgi:glycosyltransferase involved in cell wall biosynthesis|nr:glycosyltransferase family 2 protein [Eubacterium sp.]MCI9618215.1 glycosyltransferase family 2 protein [Eubacterium sp.]
MKTIDVVVPCFNEEAMLEMFYRESEKIYKNIEGYRFTYIFVNDGSKDKTHLLLKELAGNNDNVKYISFSRNFGKEAAMYAGLCNTTADYIIVMDADLQHPPALVPKMISEIEKGYDCCAAKRTSRKGESKIKSAFSALYYKLSNRFTDVQLVQNAVDFRIMSRQMVDNIIKLSEVQRFSKGIFEWVGFQTSWIPYENIERPAGETKWSFKSLFKYALTGITSFSIAPLRFLTCSGLFISFLAFVMIIVTLVRKLFFGIEVSGYASLMIAVLFMGGIIELSLGILGEYIANIYLEAKDRPIYIVQDSNIEHTK